MDDITIDEIALADPAYWAVMNKIRVPKGVFTFEKRRYLIEPMQSKAKRLCLMKGTQGGASLIIMLKMLWAMIVGKYKAGVLYLMPTEAEIQEYSKSRFAPLIDQNPSAIGKFVKGDTVSLKQVGPSPETFLYLRSGTLPRKIDIGYEESGRVKGISADAVVFDEIDIMDENLILKAIGRMGDSPHRHEIYIGNPGVPGRGIDGCFLASDQRHWWMICPKCETKTCAEKEFFDNPSFIRIDEHNFGHLSCPKCKSELDTDKGEWIPDKPENSEHMHGYRWSQLILPHTNPAEILHNFRYPPQDNIGDVYRTQLGMPYLSMENRLTKAEVFACCEQRDQEHYHEGPCAMGIDQGDLKHFVIGIRSSRNSYEVLRVGKFKEWNELSDIARQFNVRSCVVDLNPNADKAREFQRSQRFKVWLCWYSESSPLGTIYNESTGLVKPNRTECFDATGKLFTEGLVSIPRKSPEITEFVKQVCDPVCIEEKDRKTGQMKRRYRGNTDHYRHAMNYFLLAASGNRIAVSGERRRRRQTHVMNEYARI